MQNAKTDGQICAISCSSVDRLSADFTVDESGSRKMTEVEGGQWVMESGRSQVEHVPLETYDLASAGRVANASQSTGCRLLERGNFRKVPWGGRLFDTAGIGRKGRGGIRD